MEHVARAVAHADDMPLTRVRLAAMAGALAVVVSAVLMGTRDAPSSGPVAEALDRVLQRAVNGRSVRGVVVRVVSGDGRVDYHGAAGTLSADTSYFVASITKLFVTAVVMQLRHEGLLSLDDRLSAYLSGAELAGLHVRDGVDRTGEVTVRHLLAQTSGLPDYFEEPRADGSRLDRQLLAGRDTAWGFDDVMAWTRGVTAHFAPGANGKARYADTNFQLLGRVIEQVTGTTVDAAVHARVIAPLGLMRTYMYRDPSDPRPATIDGKDGPLHIPRAMASFGPDGGIVSTAEEQLRFLRAFFGGQLFPPAHLADMQEWHRIFFPIEYGVGLMRFKLPRWLSPLSASPELLGHSGLAGSFAFYSPERDVYVVGTLNSAADPGAPFRFMLRLLAAIPR